MWFLYLIILLVFIGMSMRLQCKYGQEFGLGRDYSRTISLVSGILLVIAILCVILMKWEDDCSNIVATCLLATVILQLGYFKRQLDATAYLRAKGEELSLLDQWYLSPFYIWYVITFSGVGKIIKFIMHITVVGIPAWRQMEAVCNSGDLEEWKEAIHLQARYEQAELMKAYRAGNRK